MIAIAMDILKAFDTVCLSSLHWDYPSLLTPIQLMTLPTTLLTLPPGAGGAPQGSVISPALLYHFVLDCPISDSDMTLLACALSIVKAEARANQLTTTLVRWTVCKQLTIAPQKSSVILLISNTHQSWLHAQVRIGDEVPPLKRNPKV